MLVRPRLLHRAQGLGEGLLGQAPGRVERPTDVGPGYQLMVQAELHGDPRIPHRPDEGEHGQGAVAALARKNETDICELTGHRWPYAVTGAEHRKLVRAVPQGALATPPHVQLQKGPRGFHVGGVHQRRRARRHDVLVPHPLRDAAVEAAVCARLLGRFVGVALPAERLERLRLGGHQALHTGRVIPLQVAVEALAAQRADEALGP